MTRRFLTVVSKHNLILLSMPQVIAVEKADAEASLAEALPALEEARLALSDLDKSDVTEIRYTHKQPCTRDIVP